MVVALNSTSFVARGRIALALAHLKRLSNSDWTVDDSASNLCNHWGVDPCGRQDHEENSSESAWMAYETVVPLR